ncbi:MAG TPA: hypothetical protein VNH83_21295 [Bryobacteraceae bacterium]|nr:hypothetical protein [Bryobacteraceae bacterium]
MQTQLRNFHRRPSATVFSFLAAAILAAGQTPAEKPSALDQILSRLDRLERQNRELTEEVRALRSELALSHNHASEGSDGTTTASTAPDGTHSGTVNERLDVQERRLEEQAQTKVESSQHLPVRITGMALFNAFLNSRANDSLVVPVLAPGSGGVLTGGATLRQTILGLDFRGPEVLGGGKIHGFINMDFFGGSGEPYDNLMRIRTAGLEIDWANTNVMFGQDKPLIAPREPNSLAQVGLSPLTGAGNLWLWQPQMRVEQRFHLDDRTTFRAQVGVFGTREDYGYVPPAYATSLQQVRPALQGRFSMAHSLDDERRIEVGSGFDVSTTHVAGATVPSRVFALDWFANPWRKLEFSGAFFGGHNLANLGGVGQGFTIVTYDNVIPVHSVGGWAQLSFLIAPRLTFNVFGGQQDNRNRDLRYYGMDKNQAYAGNLMYRLAPNVILSLETGQVRTTYLGVGNRLTNHHDLGFAYLF